MSPRRKRPDLTGPVPTYEELYGPEEKASAEDLGRFMAERLAAAEAAEAAVTDGLAQAAEAAVLRVVELMRSYGDRLDLLEDQQRAQAARLDMQARQLAAALPSDALPRLLRLVQRLEGPEAAPAKAFDGRLEALEDRLPPIFTDGTLARLEGLEGRLDALEGRLAEGGGGDG